MHVETETAINFTVLFSNFWIYLVSSFFVSGVFMRQHGSESCRIMCAAEEGEESQTAWDLHLNYFVLKIKPV